MAYADAPVTGVRVTAIGCNIDPENVAQWVDYIYYEFPAMALYRRLSGGVNVVEPNAEAAPLRMRFNPVSNANPDEGFYDPILKAIWISSQANVWSVLLHEFAHHIQTECGCLPDGSRIGKALLSLYESMRRPGRSPVEQMASDFEPTFFGAVPFAGARQFFQAVAAAGGVL